MQLVRHMSERFDSQHMARIQKKYPLGADFARKPDAMVTRRGGSHFAETIVNLDEYDFGEWSARCRRGALDRIFGIQRIQVVAWTDRGDYGALHWRSAARTCEASDSGIAKSYSMRQCMTGPPLPAAGTNVSKRQFYRHCNRLLQ
jgi:hypothetical protein